MVSTVRARPRRMLSSSWMIPGAAGCETTDFTRTDSIIRATSESAVYFTQSDAEAAQPEQAFLLGMGAMLSDAKWYWTNVPDQSVGCLQPASTTAIGGFEIGAFDSTSLLNVFTYGTVAPYTRVDVFRVIHDSHIASLFDRLDRWGAVSAADWEADDSDPITIKAISGARRLLHLISAASLGWFLHHGVRPHVELLASRDGGTGVILSTSSRELEFSIGPDGDMTLLVVKMDEIDPDKRYVEIGSVSFDSVAGEIGAMLG